MIVIPRDLAERADALSPQPDYRFSSDGCSGLMSWVWRTLFGKGPPWEGCCVVHDFAYWRGGTRADRRAADRALRTCVAANGHPLCAFIMWAGVRIGGVPWLPTPYRCGYGWHFPRGYQRDTNQRRRP